MSKPKILNGVNVDDLSATIEAIEGQPTIAKFKFRANNKWVNGGLNRTTVKDFYGACQTHEHKSAFVFAADEPPILLGQDQGANPVEYALTALAACITTALVYHAAARGIQLEEVESRLVGDLDLHGFLGMDDSVRKGYEGVRATFKIKADASEKELEDICKLGPTYSPVFDIFTNKVPVSILLEKKEETTELLAA